MQQLAFVGSDPVYKTLRAQIVKTIGEKADWLLVSHLERPPGPSPHWANHHQNQEHARPGVAAHKPPR